MNELNRIQHAALKAIEWACNRNDGTGNKCYWCNASQSSGAHAYKCKIGEAIAAYDSCEASLKLLLPT